MKKILAAVLLTLPLFVSAGEGFQEMCVDSEGLIDVVMEFDEKMVIQDLSGNEFRYTLWVNPTTRSWTFVESRLSSNLHCIIAVGADLERLSEF